jgi:hypothetical protein
MTAPQFFFGSSASKGVLSLTSCCLLFSAGCSDQPATEKPNVIVILTDDQGHGGAIGQIADHPDNYWDMTKPLSQRKQCYFTPGFKKMISSFLLFMLKWSVNSFI